MCVAWLSDALQDYVKLKPDDGTLKLMESCTKLGVLILDLVGLIDDHTTESNGACHGTVWPVVLDHIICI